MRQAFRAALLTRENKRARTLTNLFHIYAARSLKLRTPNARFRSVHRLLRLWHRCECIRQHHDTSLVIDKCDGEGREVESKVCSTTKTHGDFQRD